MTEPYRDSDSDNHECVRIQDNISVYPSRGRAAARAEAERFLSAAARAAVAKRSDVFSAGELCALADAIDLDVTDVPSLLEALNERGELLKRGGGAFTVARARAAISRAEERQGAYNNDENSRPLF